MPIIRAVFKYLFVKKSQIDFGTIVRQLQPPNVVVANVVRRIMCLCVRRGQRATSEQKAIDGEVSELSGEREMSAEPGQGALERTRQNEFDSR